ncbi:PadR family transcriptional regulator [Methylobacterium sp. J-026]|uniref:PadR family transcriptional regulator n=1 Tax=Methylobacterium sp. J-026 TaxID=2836624 RepID=UPI001FBBBB19|nr:PadR family transcriptional regulator [Methylobacterium sp. J-026]MCJ2135247.1 PadR family transcriptional regulator [Methylobacterium sp. J-026]
MDTFRSDPFHTHPFDAYRVRAHRGPMGGDPHGRHGPHGPHGRGERRMFGRGGRGDLARFFAHGDLRLVILHLIAEKPRHGYEIIKAIEERVGGAYSPSPGTVYPTLTLLEELGHVTVTQGEGTKRLHTITPEGQAVLDGNRPTLEAILARMAQAEAARGDGPPPALVRAREGLTLALQMRLARGPLDAGQVAAITAALEAVTAAVERA